tara:strand:+ start:632 stop:1633 length:1002 start_codon:yes stop_codon:yes gene_type:complete
MIIKSYLIEQNINQLDKYNCVLLYGENEGIKDDIKEKIKIKNPDAEIINLFQDEIAHEKNILIKNLENSSLFNAKKIIFLHEITDKVFNHIYNLKNLINSENRVFILSNILDKKSKIRALFEKETFLACIACYQDNEKTLSLYIRNSLKEYSGLSQDIINLIIYNSSNDRKKIKNEIIKIKDFFIEKKLNKDDIGKILNIKLDNNFSLLRDATLVGDKNKINKIMGEMEFLTEDNYYYLNNVCQRIKKLLEVKKLSNNINDCSSIIEKPSMKIFWKDRQAFSEQIRKWDQKELINALKEINSTEILMKKNSTIRNDILIKNLMISLCNKTFIS